MNPDNFCKIRNGCFPSADDNELRDGPPTDPLFRKIMASTKISQLLGVEPVAAEGVLKGGTTTTIPEELNYQEQNKRAWWYDVGDYLEDPHRHFKAMDSLRLVMDWPEDVKK